MTLPGFIMFGSHKIALLTNLCDIAYDSCRTVNMDTGMLSYFYLQRTPFHSHVAFMLLILRIKLYSSETKTYGYN